MNRVPAFPPRFFHRIKIGGENIPQTTDNRRLKEMIASNSTSMVSEKDALPFRQGHGLVVAAWNRWDPATRAQVRALGIVMNTDSASLRKVRWIEVQCELPKITSSGDHFWDQPTFKFADSVAKNFQLAELFEKHRSGFTPPTGEKTLHLIDTAALERALEEFAKARDWEQFHSPKNLAMALTGEVGELVELAYRRIRSMPGMLNTCRKGRLDPESF